MPTVDLKNWKNEVMGSMELADSVFNVPFKPHLIWEYVRYYQAGLRRGTASTKTRAEVSGSGNKLWRQKGTGRARMGSIRSPLWRKGGVVHGPKPRDYGMKMNKKQRRLALCVALSERLREGNLLVLDSMELEDHKTKHLAELLQNFGEPKKCLLVDTLEENQELKLASRNLPYVESMHPNGMNAYHVTRYPRILISQRAVKKLMEVLT